MIIKYIILFLYKFFVLFVDKDFDWIELILLVGWLLYVVGWGWFLYDGLFI